MEEQTFVQWVELPGAQPVCFDDLPALIAAALHVDEMAQAIAEAQLSGELRAMVTAGEVIVRNALTLGPHTFPIGQALPRALNEGHHEGGALTKPLHDWTDEEIETTRQTGLQAARVRRVLEQSARSSRVLDALLAVEEAPTHRRATAPPPVAPAPAVQRPARAAELGQFTKEQWKVRARAAARAIIKRAAARSLYPPQGDIADEVAADLRKRGVFGADGKPLSGATIKRWVTLPPENVPLAECFNASKEDGNDEDSAGALHA